MVSPLPLLLLALTATPGAQQQQQSGGGECASSDWADLVSDNLDLIKEILLDPSNQVEDLKNATTQLLGVLNTVKSRQAVAAAIQAAQLFLFLAYLTTIFVFYIVKHCKKKQKEIAKAEFELLETKLQASRSRRRAAAAARSNKQTPQ